MKRAGNLIDRIADADNLRLAFWKASKGKRAKGDVLAFRAGLDSQLRALREELLAGSVCWGPYRRFMIYDPKERMICAAPFRDRRPTSARGETARPGGAGRLSGKKLEGPAGPFHQSFFG